LGTSHTMCTPAHLPQCLAGVPCAPPACLALAPSILRLQVLVHNRLAEWLPVNLHQPQNATGELIPFLEEDLSRVLCAAELGYEQSTWATYSTGLLYYIEWANWKDVPDASRCPVLKVLLELFVPDMIGTFLGSVVDNTVTAMCAWHIIHGQPWSVLLGDLAALLRLAQKNTPAKSKQPSARHVGLCLLSGLDWSATSAIARTLCSLLVSPQLSGEQLVWASLLCQRSKAASSLKSMSPLTMSWRVLTSTGTLCASLRCPSQRQSRTASRLCGHRRQDHWICMRHLYGMWL
jgi:hypothetical protein